MTRQRSRHRGFTIAEMIMAVILVGVLMTLGAQLFQTVIRAGRSATDAHDAASSFDAAVAALRSDVWGASEIALDAGDSTVTLKGADGSAITWSIAEQTIQRTQSGVPTRKWPIPANVRFAAQRPGLRLQLRGGRNFPAGEIDLISEVRLLENTHT
jgi:prepilin-type N-terminal cleavage/methylation domain-containing protein